MNDAQGILAHVPATTKKCQARQTSSLPRGTLPIKVRSLIPHFFSYPIPNNQPLSDVAQGLNRNPFWALSAFPARKPRVLLWKRYGSSHDVSFDDPATGGKPWYLSERGCPSGIYLGFFLVHGMVDAGFEYLRRWVQRRGKRRGFDRAFLALQNFRQSKAWKLIESYWSCLLWFLVRAIVYIRQSLIIATRM